MYHHLKEAAARQQFFPSGQTPIPLRAGMKGPIRKFVISTDSPMVTNKLLQDSSCRQHLANGYETHCAGKMCLHAETHALIIAGGLGSERANPKTNLQQCRLNAE